MLKRLSPADAVPDDRLKRMEAVANLLDTAFVLPGTTQRIGIDAIIGLFPGVGDLLTTALSSYIIWEARRLGVSRLALTRMLGNLAIHAVAGLVPVLGDGFIALFRVNQRNLRIVRSQLARQASLSRPGQAVVQGSARATRVRATPRGHAL